MGVSISPVVLVDMGEHKDVADHTEYRNLDTHVTYGTLQTIFDQLLLSEDVCAGRLDLTYWNDILTREYDRLTAKFTMPRWPEGHLTWTWEESDEWYQANKPGEPTVGEETFLKWAPQLIAQSNAGVLRGATHVSWC